MQDSEDIEPNELTDFPVLRWETKWLLFCKQHFHIQFLAYTLLYFDPISLKFVLKDPILSTSDAVLPLFATRVGACTGGILVIFIEARIF